MLNTNRPYDKETKELAESLKERYNVSVMPVNVAQLKSEVISLAKNMIFNMKAMKDINERSVNTESEHIKSVNISNKDMSNGNVLINMNIDEKIYYEIISFLTGNTIKNEYELIGTLKELKELRDEFTQVNSALEAVAMKGYGVVIPKREEIALDEPEIIKNGNKIGIKIKAKAPSVHMIKADVLTEIAPIVGSEEIDCLMKHKQRCKKLLQKLLMKLKVGLFVLYYDLINTIGTFVYLLFVWKELQK